MGRGDEREANALPPSPTDQTIKTFEGTLGYKSTLVHRTLEIKCLHLTFQERKGKMYREVSSRQLPEFR